MSEKTLLASVVLFGELYDNDKDIYDVIAEFIKAALIFCSRWTTNTTEVTQLLKSEFDLCIPEAVIRTTLHKRLYMRDGVLSEDKGHYAVVKSKLDPSHSLVDQLADLRQQQDDLLAKLVSHIEVFRGPLLDSQRTLLIKCFCDYLFSSGRPNQFSEDISSFIIKFQNEPGLSDQLNAVREGFVLYDGVRHTPDLNEIGTWKESLIVYLDTEHLFNAVGFNGDLHKQLFKDFYSLANDVRLKGSRLISLQYFTECTDELDRFFHVAEQILDGNASLDPSKPAMAAIIDGCGTKSDVIAKKAKFRTQLQTLGIVEAKGSVADVDKKYNLGGIELLNKVKSELETKNRDFNEDKCISTLQMLTKINASRQGRSEGAFETIGHILVSGSYLSNYLAFHPDVWTGNGNIPLATDLEFITNRLWFKLHKGLSSSLVHPQSLNVLAKAQVVLASQINSSISEKFNQIQNNYASGNLKKTDAQYLFDELRTKVYAPEMLTEEAVKSAFEFLDHNNYEHHLRERSLLMERVEAGNRAVSELEAIRSAAKLRKLKICTALSFLFHSAGTVILFGFIILCYYGCYALFKSIATEQDSLLSIIGIILGLVPGTLPFIKAKRIVAWVKGSHSRTVNKLMLHSA